MDGLKWYHLPLLLVAGFFGTPCEIIRNVFTKRCSVKGCGMKAEQEGMCMGHFACKDGGCE